MSRTQKRANRVIRADGRSLRRIDPIYEFSLRDLCAAVLIVVVCFGIAGYLSV